MQDVTFNWSDSFGEGGDRKTTQHQKVKGHATRCWNTLPEINSSHLNIFFFLTVKSSPTPTFCRCYRLVWGRVWRCLTIFPKMSIAINFEITRVHVVQKEEWSNYMTLFEIWILTFCKQFSIWQKHLPIDFEDSGLKLIAFRMALNHITVRWVRHKECI